MRKRGVIVAAPALLTLLPALLAAGLLASLAQASGSSGSNPPLNNAVISAPASSPTPTPRPTCGPGSPYIISESMGATLVPGTTDVGNHCDDCTTLVTLPFPYALYGLSFNSIHVSSNGEVGFGYASSLYNNTCLPSTPARFSIFPYWDDLRTDTPASGIFTSVSGSAPQPDLQHRMARYLLLNR